MNLNVLYIIIFDIATKYVELSVESLATSFSFNLNQLSSLLDSYFFITTGFDILSKVNEIAGSAVR